MNAQPEPSNSHQETDEYAHLHPDTVLEDAVELFEAGSEPPPVLNPDDPPPATADDEDSSI